MIASLLLPTAIPLIDMLMLDNLFCKSGVMRQLAGTASNALMYIVVILSGTSVGATTSTEVLLRADILKIVFLELVTFAFNTAASVLLGKLVCKLIGDKVNLLVGSVDVSAVPMSARVSQRAGTEADPTNFLLTYVMGPNVASIIGTVVAAGTFMVIFGVK